MLSQFLRGQLTVMAILAVLYSVAYALLGVQLAVPIGIVAGMLNFIPYLGSGFALVAGLLMSLLDGWHFWQLVGVVLAYAAVQTLEGFVITPRVVGHTVGLSEIWVLVLFVGGELFGFLGVLLAVPAAAVAKIFVAPAVRYYRRTALFRPCPPPPTLKGIRLAMTGSRARARGSPRARPLHPAPSLGAPVVSPHCLCSRSVCMRGPRPFRMFLMGSSSAHAAGSGLLVRLGVAPDRRRRHGRGRVTCCRALGGGRAGRAGRGLDLLGLRSHPAEPCARGGRWPESG